MDPRIVKTKRDIRNALVELLKEMPYEKVTIKLVSDKAMVARPTFYAHYDSIQDILIDYLSDLFVTASNMKDLPRDLSVESLKMYYHWMSKNKEILDLLYKNNLEGILYKLNRKYIYDKNLLRPSSLDLIKHTDPLYVKYVEAISGILFCETIALIEREWTKSVDSSAEETYKSAVFIVSGILRSAGYAI